MKIIISNKIGTHTLIKSSRGKSDCLIPVADPRGRGGGGGATGAPLKLDQLCFFAIQFFYYIRMLKNKAQIERESIKTTPELPGSLRGQWTPAETEFGSALVMCVRAHNLLRPPPPPP